MYAQPHHSGWLRRGGAGGQGAREASRLRVATLLVLTAGVCVMLLPTPPVSAQENPEESPAPVYLLNAMYSNSDITKDDARAVWAGMDAAFFNSGYRAAGGRPIHIVDPSPAAVAQGDITQAILEALRVHPSLLTVLGPYGDSNLAQVFSNAAVTESGLVMMAPFTGSSGVRQWSDSVYFTRTEPMAELKAIIQHIILDIRPRRVAFMHLTGVDFGDLELSYMQKTFKSMGRNLAVVYAVPFSESGVLDMQAFGSMADTRPQVIVVWGAPGKQVVDFLKEVLRDPRTSSAHIISCSMLQRIVFDAYKDLLSTGAAVARDSHILASATASPVSDATPYFMKVFRAEMAKYIAESGHSYSLSPGDNPGERYLQENPHVAQLMLLGWLSGKVVQQTLARPHWIDNRTTYKRGLFDQNRYVIAEDYVLGDYGGECRHGVELFGAMCNCNQGGHLALMTSLRELSWEMVPSSFFVYPQTECTSSSVDMYDVADAVTLLFEEYPRMVAAGEQIRDMLLRDFRENNCRVRRMGHAVLRVTRETVQSRFDAEVKNFIVDFVAGPISDILDVGEVVVISPLYPHPHLITPRQNYVYLMPTLEQEIFVLYANIDAVRAVTSATTGTRVVLRDYQAEEARDITDILFKTAGTHDVPDPSVVGVPFTENVHRALGTGGINFLIGMTVGDAASIANWLAMYPAAIVVITFDDLTIFYAELVEAFSTQPTSVQARLMSFNSIPLWSDTSAEARTASPALAVFHDRFPNPADHTPSMLRDMIISRLLQDLSSSVEVVNPQGLKAALYINAGVTVYGLTFGPFRWGCTTTTSGEACAYENYGASNIAILSMQRMLDPTAPQVSPPITPSMRYRPRTKSGSLTPEQRNGIIAGATLFAVALVAACVLMVYCCTDSRDNDAAPKDHSAPVTLVFTDIESSTALWAALPQLMADAIAAHHAVIRQVIREFKCYEVKTIGDSFMIACKDAHVAVLLACEIQAKLLRYDWGTVSIDGAYRDFELARVETVDDYVPPTAQLGDEEYAALWRGLRVRMGIHTGLCDIRYDEVTKGYDYYGDTPNMAARTEAVANGGQVVATESTWWALSDDERASIAHTAMGPQGLRGVPFAVELFQLDAVPGRRHAALRTEIDAVLPDEAATETGSSAAGALLSSVDTMTGAAANVAFVLSSCFAPYPVAQRVRELQPLLTKWSVGAPPRSRHVSEEDYCRGLVNRLATRIAAVSQARQQVESDGVLAPADVPQLGPGGASNPLAGASGRISEDMTPQQSLMTALPRVVERSAMRESSVLRSSALRRSPLSTGPSSRGESGDMDTAGCSDDAVVPFNYQPWRRVSEERSSRSGSATMSDDVVVVRMPENLRYLHTSKVPDARGEKVTGDAPPAVRGACPPPVYGL